MKYVVAILGVALMWYSEYDDAPGGVLLGMLLVGGAVLYGVRAARRGEGSR